MYIYKSNSCAIAIKMVKQNKPGFDAQLTQEMIAQKEIVGIWDGFIPWGSIQVPSSSPKHVHNCTQHHMSIILGECKQCVYHNSVVGVNLGMIRWGARVRARAVIGFSPFLHRPSAKEARLSSCKKRRCHRVSHTFCICAAAAADWQSSLVWYSFVLDVTYAMFLGLHFPGLQFLG
jgi:hypothetical protein